MVPGVRTLTVKAICFKNSQAMFNALTAGCSVLAHEVKSEKGTFRSVRSVRVVADVVEAKEVVLAVKQIDGVELLSWMYSDGTEEVF